MDAMIQKLRIYICTHTDFKPLVKNPVYEVVDTRQYNGDMCANGLHGSFYSELLMYKYVSERKDLPEYVGFCGYRKYYSFRDDVPDMDAIFKEHDAIATTPMRIEPDVRGHYLHYHNGHDLDIVTDIIRNDYPTLFPTFIQSLSQKEFYACNMFIVRRDDFLWLINTVFGILDKYLEVVTAGIETEGDPILARIAAHKKDYHIGMEPSLTMEYEYRIGGYLGERIVNTLLLHRFRNIKHYNMIVTRNAVSPRLPLTKASL